MDEIDNAIDEHLRKVMRKRMVARASVVAGQVAEELFGATKPAAALAEPATMPVTGNVLAGDPVKVAAEAAKAVHRSIGARGSKKRAGAPKRSAKAADAPMAPITRSKPGAGPRAAIVAWLSEHDAVTFAELADFTGGLEATDEAKRQAFAKLKKSGQVQVVGSGDEARIQLAKRADPT